MNTRKRKRPTKRRTETKSKYVIGMIGQKFVSRTVHFDSHFMRCAELACLFTSVAVGGWVGI